MVHLKGTTFTFLWASLIGDQANGFCLKNLKVTLPNSLLHKSSAKISSTTTMMTALDGINLKRRDFITAAIASTVASPLLVPSLSNAIDVEQGEDAKTNTVGTRFTSAQIQNFLQPIPTFAIVDNTGTPYMVVGEDAKLSAYFFTSYAEADRILSVANKSVTKSIREAKKEENAKRKASGEKILTKEEADDVIGINPWSSARVSSVPLDFAAGLAFKGKVKGAYFRLAPAEDDVQDAIEIDKLDDLAEGKVPLFYFEDFTLDLKDGEELWSGGESNKGAKKKYPLYFSKRQLLQDWKKMNRNAKKEDIPEIKVTELFSLLTTMVKAVDGSDDDLEKLVLLPPSDSEAKAKICLKKNGDEKAYKLGERIVVL